MCVEYAKLGLVVTYSCSIVLMVVLQFIVSQTLYYGWKEQEELADGEASRVADNYERHAAI